jgi:hypothetical protein
MCEEAQKGMPKVLAGAQCGVILEVRIGQTLNRRQTMTNATPTDRAIFAADWSHGSRVIARGVRCDHCDAKASIPVTNSTDAHFLCPDGYRAYLAAERASRPTMAERLAHIASSIAGA